jgi:hypothetical protein
VFVFASVTATGSGFQENVNRDPDPGNSMQCESLRSGSGTPLIKSMRPTFWEIMLLLTLKGHDFVQIFVVGKLCLDPEPKPEPEPKLALQGLFLNKYRYQVGTIKITSVADPGSGAFLTPGPDPV